MSSDRVIAISSQVVECGKRLSDSKKRFVWRFKIGDTTYDLQLVSSALSGKRSITLNDKPIYSQQNLLNIKFDFNHNIDGHSLRIFRQSQGVHNFDLRIDNRSFEYLLKKKDNPVTEQKVSGKYQASSNNDPFSQFQKLANNSQKNSKSVDEFGEFDDFSWGNQKKEAAKQAKVEQNIDFGFDNASKKQPLINLQSFQTNNMSNFQKNFNNADLLSSQNFTTNNYGNYNNYLDLINDKEGKSDTWGMEVDPKQKTFIQKIKPDMTGKQMINKTLMTAVEIKKKAVNQFQSLI